MVKQYPLALHIFRRDLRLEDNTALIEALKSAKNVIPCFIFDPKQIEKNDYKSDHAIQFMLNSLQELAQALEEKQGKLYFFYGSPLEVITQLLSLQPIEAIFINRDYTPYSRERDRAIETLCKKRGIAFHSFADALLHEPEQVLKANQQPYTIFTHAFRKATELSVSPPQKNHSVNYFNQPIALENHDIFSRLVQKNNPNLVVKGGRKEGLTLLKNIKELADYQTLRNYPWANKTTHLSAHNKFGTLSIREVYARILHCFNQHHTLITELHWRDFFTHIAYHFPYVFKTAFHEQYAHLPWRYDEKQFLAWCEGRTGFPLVDAGMRELNTTGYMHNRVRMVVASFLTKDLHIDWRLGEKYFAQQLVDYDPAVNNGNWQWAASTGCDAQPYFRIFNPWLQQQKFDADCLYIKRFIPELALLPAKVIHHWYEKPKGFMTNYPFPIVDHSIQSQIAKKMYQTANKK